MTQEGFNRGKKTSSVETSEETVFSAEGLLNRNFSGKQADEDFTEFKKKIGITSEQTNVKQERSSDRPLMRDRFLEHFNRNKDAKATDPGNEANTQITNEIRGDETLTEEERSRQLEDLRAVFSSFARNNRFFS